MKKLKFVMLKGLQGSGKSTWANEYVLANPNTVRINNDSIQLMMFCMEFAKGKNDILTSARAALIEVAYNHSQNLILDNTNLDPKREIEYRALVEEWNKSLTGPKYEFIVKDFTDVPLAECLKRNRNRANPVPDKVIYDFYEKFIKKDIPKLMQDESLPKAVIIDIDGTIADISHRGPYEQHKVLQDGVIETACEIVRLMYAAGYKIIYLSGREEYCRADSLKWITETANLPCDLLLLNKTGEKRSSSITKREIFDEFIKDKYNVKLVLEDRTKNTIVWRQMGLTCYQVDDGNF